MGKFQGISLEDGSLISESARSPTEFTEPGDSGSLIVLHLEEDGVLVPVGVHFASDDAGNSFSVPLWNVFSHFYDENALQGELKVHFLSPWLKEFGFQRDLYQK